MDGAVDVSSPPISGSREPGQALLFADHQSTAVSTVHVHAATSPSEPLRARRQSSASYDHLPSLVEDDARVSSPAVNSVIRTPSQESLPATFDVQHRGRCRLTSLFSCLGSWLFRNRLIIGVIASWYLLGVVAIVTTKLLLMEWHVPPLLLTFQQLLLASTLLRLRLATCTTNGAQPMPAFRLKGAGRALEVDDAPDGDVEQASLVGVIDRTPSASTEQMTSTAEDTDDDNASPLDFYLAGLFNCMDFLASNTAFSASAASFVETVKASDPLTTTAVALAYRVDRLGASEAFGLGILVSGILLSTWGSGGSGVNHPYHRALHDASHSHSQDNLTLDSSLHSAMLVVVANFSFAFRAMTQKLYQRHAKVSLDDENLLCRLQQLGWMTLLLPVLVLYSGTLKQSMFVEQNKTEYFKLSLLNASAYATYNWASTFVLSKLSVVQHSTLGCLRRLFVIIMTCLFFGVPLTLIGCLGILMSFVGFASFTHFRRKRHLDDAKSFNVE